MRISHSFIECHSHSHVVQSSCGHHNHANCDGHCEQAVGFCLGEVWNWLSTYLHPKNVCIAGNDQTAKKWDDEC